MRKVFVLVLVSLIVMLTMPLIFTNVALANATDATHINITVEEAKEMTGENQNIVTLDVRTLAEYNSGHIARAESLPLSEMGCRACLHAFLDKYEDKSLLVYCRSGIKSEDACNILVNQGYEKVYKMRGGLNAWVDAGFPVVSDSTANQIFPSNDSLSSEIDNILSSGKPVFLFLYVDWCHFCQQQIPIIDDLEQEYAQNITFLRVNGEEDPDARKVFGASRYPSMFLIRARGDDGRYESQYFRGFGDNETLKKSIDWIIANESIYENGKENERGIFGSELHLFGNTEGKDLPVSDFSVSDTEVSEVIDLLRTLYFVPVSFIEATDDHRVTINIEKGTVQDVIEHAIAQSPEYRWMDMNGRLVVYPDRPEYETIVSGVDIVEIPRLDAARLYIDHLKNETETFEIFSGVVMKGNPRSPVYSTVVSLSTQAPVISHFVEILGANPSVVFSIRSTQSGVFVFLLEKIKKPPPSALDVVFLLEKIKKPPLSALDVIACCCPLSITYANLQDLSCNHGDCGARIQFDITQVTTSPGCDCQGKRLTETVTTDNGCGPGSVETGDGCPIGAGNTFSGCTDIYDLCGPASAFPAGGCVETYTQTLYVAGDDVERCSITFTITKNGACSGTVTRSCSQLNDPENCACCPVGSPNAGTCYTPGTPQDGCCEYDGNCYSGTLDPAVCEVCYGGTWYPGQTCCGTGTPNSGKCYTEHTSEYGCCEYSGGCFSGPLDPEKCRVCYGGTWHSGQTCCGTGTPNSGKCYTEHTSEYGCCGYSGSCFSGTLDPEKCRVCYGGTWSSGENCCDDGNCHECCTDDDCPEGKECVDYTCQEVPEFPAGVTAVFGTSMLMFFMMRRKYVRK